MTSYAYYNEIDPYAAQWLRNLIAAGHITDGFVDERSVVDVQPSDLIGYNQCHFFAGLGGWSHALRLAGWPDDRQVWTGSPPCQPFSVAGQQKGKDDERHLAPHWLELVSQCRPPSLFGEQVEAAIRHGWFDDLQAHLEAEGYACGMVVLPACGVGAPHIRQRQWIVAEMLANPNNPRPQGWGRVPECADQLPAGTGSLEGGLANTDNGQCERWAEAARRNDSNRENSGREEGDCRAAGSCGTGGMADTDINGCNQAGECQPEAGRDGIVGNGATVGLADTGGARRERGRASETVFKPEEQQRSAGLRDAYTGEPATCPTDSFWRDPDWLFCRDGKWRPVEPGTFPLAHGATARVGRLRAYGNAIVPQVAAEVIRAYMNY